MNFVSVALAGLFAIAPLGAGAQTPAAVASDQPIAFAKLPLEAAERAAVAQSPDVNAAAAALRERRAAYAAARGTLGPSLVAGYAEAPQGGSNNDVIRQRLTTVGVQTTVGDLLQYSPLMAAAQANQVAAQATLTAAERSERVKTIGLYYGALKARSIAAARASALETARRERDAAALRVQSGDAPRLDLVRANVAVARATAAAATAQAADRNATEALRVETAAASPLEQTVTGLTPSAAVIAPDAAVALALKNRADLKAALQTTLAARATARAAHRGVLPALTVGVGYEGGVDAGVQVHGPTVNVSMTLPLRGQAAAEAAQKDAIVAEDLAKEQALARDVLLAVSAAARNLAAARSASAAAAEARSQARSELNASELGYRNGATSSLELASARDTYTQAVVDDVSAVYDELQAQATLMLEIGP